MSGVIAPSSTPRNPVEDDGDSGGGGGGGGGGGATPVTIILGGGIVGASALIVIIVLVLIVVFVLKTRRRRRAPVRKGGEEGRQRASPSEQLNPDSRQEMDISPPLNGPLYAKISKQVPPPIPSRSNSLRSNGGPLVMSTARATTPKPRELLAFSEMNIPKTFKPYTPPPPITAHATGHPRGKRLSATVYDIPEAMYDDSPDFDAPSGYDMLKEGLFSPEHSHDDFHDSGMLTASIDTESPPSLTASNSFQSSLGRKASGDQAVSNRQLRKSHYNHIYTEQLEPSMLHNSVSPESSTSSLGLPYAPIYDIPRRSKRDAMAPLQISRQNIVELQELGFGHFGRVVLGATVGLSLKNLHLGPNDDTSTSILVAIKKLRPDADYELMESFEREIKFMSKMRHANVVRLLGACKGTEESFIVMEYMENGDLHDFLQKQKLVSDTLGKIEENEVTPLLLLYMSVQLASGMRYLASRKFIHRDLAARNCLVGRDFVVKISDFGMSRNLYESLYYRIQGRLILPIRWMAYESFYGQFSVKSDVWSYGVTVWEIFGLACFEPYHEITDKEFIDDAIKGADRKLLQKPEACPQDVYDILLRCWVHEPTMRADFEEVYSRLFMAYTNLSKKHAH